MELTSKRRAYLRKKAHDLDALVRIGNRSYTDNGASSFRLCKSRI